MPPRRCASHLLKELRVQFDWPQYMGQRTLAGAMSLTLLSLGNMSPTWKSWFSVSEPVDSDPGPRIPDSTEQRSKWSPGRLTHPQVCWDCPRDTELFCFFCCNSSPIKKCFLIYNLVLLYCSLWRQKQLFSVDESNRCYVWMSLLCT